MTTRRAVLTGLAAVPITAATGSAAEASPAPPIPPAPAPAVPDFLHEIDRQVYEDLRQLAGLVEQMKDRLIVANNENPMIRYGGLFDMRNAFGPVGMIVDSLRPIIEVQRAMAHIDRVMAEIRLETEGRPHTPEFLARHRRETEA